QKEQDLAILLSRAEGLPRPEVESALGRVEGELKGQGVTPWQLVRLARAGVQVGLEERVQELARLVPDAAVRGRMQLEVLRGRLADRKGPADDSWVQIVDANAPVHPLARELLARHNARYGDAAAMQRTV